MKRLLMEFLGTFFLVLAVAVTANPLAVATMVMAWVYLGGHVSGAHYNPAVSLAAVFAGHLSWHTFFRYVAAQVAGAFLAFFFAAFLHGQAVIPQPGVGVNFLQALSVEILLAFVLAFVVLTVAMSDKFKNNYIYGIAIGFTFVALILIGSPISGGVFNPAVALGSHLYGALRGINIIWNDLIMYVGGGLLGGYLAAHAYNYFMPERAR